MLGAVAFSALDLQASWARIWELKNAASLPCGVYIRPFTFSRKTSGTGALEARNQFKKAVSVKAS
eukprot:2196028-Alexandrium_andersonii.AAC.1